MIISDDEKPRLAGRGSEVENGLPTENNQGDNSPGGGRAQPNSTSVDLLSLLDRLDPRIKDVVRQCPRAGSGVHKYVFWLACECRRAGLSDAEAFALMRFSTRKCGRTVPDREIGDAVRNSAKSKGTGAVLPQPPDRQSSKVEHCPQFAKRVLGTRITFPAPTEIPSTADELLLKLFPWDSLLCVGKQLNTMGTFPFSELYGNMGGFQFIVPSPMADRVGVNKEGRHSARCLDNTGPRLHLVVEFDHHTLEEQQLFHGYLSQFAPLLFMCFSGSKSIHGWYRVGEMNPLDVGSLWGHALRLGADPMTFTKCQAVRMPNGVRWDDRSRGIKQEVISCFV